MRSTCAIRAGVKALTGLRLTILLSGRVAISQLRAVELDDLLGRDPVQLDDAGLHELLAGKTVLGTGAGGFQSLELCRRLGVSSPQNLPAVRGSEFALYNMEQEAHPHFSAAQELCVLAGDARVMRRRVEQVCCRIQNLRSFFSMRRRNKHVPLMEQQTAWQAVGATIVVWHLVRGEHRTATWQGQIRA